MKKEQNILLLAMILNIIVAIIKFVGGIIFNFSSLVADSLHSFSDFITDIISLVASKIGKKRANKKHPFGYGMIENISNLIIGIILFLLGIYILINGFMPREVIVKPIIFGIIIITIVIKVIIVGYLYSTGKKVNSNTLIISAKESSTDLISSVIVLIVLVLLTLEKYVPIFKYADSLGSIIISLIVFNIAFKIIRDNVQYLLGVSEENKEVIQEIEKIVKKEKMVKDCSLRLMRMGNYYNLYLAILLDSNMTLGKLFQLENRLKKKIKKSKYNIRFIEIEPMEYK